MSKIIGCSTAALLLLAVPFLEAGEATDSWRPRMDIPIIEKAPVIDGDLSEESWSRAAVIDAMTEVDPIEGAPGDPPTEILLMRDAEYFYFAFICHEPAVDRLVLQDMHRDAFQREDDAVKILLDPFGDEKNGYYFVISAAGSRLDALVANDGQQLNFNWNGFWQAKTAILSDRWITEIAIPFQTLAFGKQPIWGANFERYRGVNRSRCRWTGAVRQYRVTTVSVAGKLNMKDGLEQGLGLEFLPYAKVKYTRRHDPRDGDLLGDLGGEINWRITPQLNSSITINTDFAETEVDARQVNLTRFSLFFPEKRNFFLEDSSFFLFGWGAGGFSGRPDVVPYFSRRIGLSPEGEEIPIEYGGRLAGRVGRFDLGFLGVHTDALDSEAIPASGLFVARPAYRATDELTLGALFTGGNPTSKEDNYVGGADIQFASTRKLPGLWTVNAYLLGSSDEENDEDGGAYGLRSTLKTNAWYFLLETLYTQDAFHPGLGFVRRPGERRYAGRIEWEPNPGSDWIRDFEFSLSPSIWTEPNGTVISQSLRTGLLEVEWHSGDRFSLTHHLDTDRLEEDFEPVEGSLIPPGEYNWQSLSTEFSSSRSRPLSASVEVEGGSWYNGHQLRFETSGSWNPTPHLELKLGYEQNQFRIPGPNFTTRVETLRFNYDFTPNIRIESLVQADNVSDNIGFQSRFRWLIEDGRELFFVINSSWVEDEKGRIVPEGQDYTVKLKYAIRF